MRATIACSSDDLAGPSLTVPGSPRRRSAREQATPAWTSQRCEIAMDEVHRYGALAHCRRHPLDRIVADVAGGEDAGNACFEQVGCPLERPSREILLAGEIRAGENEAVAVARQTVGQPFGTRRGADEDEQEAG